MAKKPKLTPTFADTVIEVQPPSPVMTFPTSRTAAGGTFSGLSFNTPTSEPSSTVKTKREKVAIIGTAPSSLMLAPFKDMNWGIWVCSPGNKEAIPRVDAWFEIHANLHWPTIIDAYGKDYLEWLSKQSFPIYMQDEPWHQKYLPNAQKFPARELTKEFGVWWFQSTFAWMTAYAIYTGYKEIGLFGVDMASKDEYHLQRVGFHRWTEIAEERGVKVVIPLESDLAQAPGLYGFSEATPRGRKLYARQDELTGRSNSMAQEIQKAAAQMESLKTNKLYIDGAKEDNEYQFTIWPGQPDEWREPSLEIALKVVEAAGYQVTKPEPEVELKESTNG